MLTKKKIIFICTANACRSQIAHGLLESMAGDKFEVFSAGSYPSQVHPMSIKVMEEIGIDISYNKSDLVDDYLKTGIEVVITVCDHANEICPIFPGNIEKIHWSINDPFKGWDYNKNQMQSFRKTRDEIKERIINFLNDR
tara:strand:+ start:217 stop:636 length:420 start_codon:yes stop_codon:yes gene_type:complete